MVISGPKESPTELVAIVEFPQIHLRGLQDMKTAGIDVIKVLILKGGLKILSSTDGSSHQTSE